MAGTPEEGNCVASSLSLKEARLMALSLAKVCGLGVSGRCTCKSGYPPARAGIAWRWAADDLYGLASAHTEFPCGDAFSF